MLITNSYYCLLVDLGYLVLCTLLLTPICVRSRYVHVSNVFFLLALFISFSKRLKKNCCWPHFLSFFGFSRLWSVVVDWFAVDDGACVCRIDERKSFVAAVNGNVFCCCCWRILVWSTIIYAIAHEMHSWTCVNQISYTHIKHTWYTECDNVAEQKHCFGQFLVSFGLHVWNTHNTNGE